jgi:hypothetical protein
MTIWRAIKKSGTRCVNEGIISLNRNLRDRKIPTVFITESFDGRKLSGEGEPVIARWRRKDLAKKGYHAYIPGNGDTMECYLDVGEDKCYYENLMPYVTDGIISTNKTPKNICLRAFLDKMHLPTQRILMIEDSKKILEHVAKFCEAAGLDFLGIHYTEGLLHTYTLPSGKFRSAWMELFQEMRLPE